jgi:nitronate monooxygenase
MLDRLAVPIVQAPMAGGASTPRLAAAVSDAGGLGFLAAGYRTAQEVAGDLAALRALTARPFGVNVFTPGAVAGEPAAAVAYAATLEGEARRAGVALGAPRRDDDAYAAKVALLAAEPVAVVSFTFGLPGADDVARLRAAGSAVWITVTDAAEARAAAGLEPDALVVQGAEAGGHRGTFADGPGAGELTLLAALQLVDAAVDLPLVATGGLTTGRGVAAALAAGARAAAVGSAFLRCPESATSAPHRAALAAAAAPTRLTRAFSGRRARGLVNRWMDEHDADAPVSYPDVHHVTTPVRAAGRAAGDADVVNLWAGQAYALAQERPAAEVLAQLWADARAALAQAAERAAAPASASRSSP